MASKPEEERDDFMLSIPFPRAHNELLKVVAKKEGRSAAGHVRFLIMKSLQEHGLVNEHLEPIEQEHPE